jgi:sugar/nucleoside kinase (ribokinase family)
MNPIRQLWKDPRLVLLIAVGGGAVKGAIVGVAIGKVGAAVALGVCGGALVGTVLARRLRQPNVATTSTRPDLQP